METPVCKIVFRLSIVTFAFLLPFTSVSWAKGKKTVLTGPALAGQKLFQENCALCHFANESRNKIGPGMKGLYRMKDLPYSHKPVTDANVRAQVEKGNPEGKPMPMPAFGNKLSKSDMDNLIAYLKTL